MKHAPFTCLWTLRKIDFHTSCFSWNYLHKLEFCTVLFIMANGSSVSNRSVSIDSVYKIKLIQKGVRLIQFYDEVAQHNHCSDQNLP